jgi:transcriptional regulator with XRE-family HTH domain
MAVMTFGARLARARRAAGIESARELDRRIDVAEGYTSLLESGARENPSGKVVVRYARELGVTAEWLVDGVGEGPQEAA